MAERPTVASQSAHVADKSYAIKSHLEDVLRRVEGIHPPPPVNALPLAASQPDNCINFSLMQANDTLQECILLLSKIEAALGG